jgi:Sulfatase-modifying factor enzyme 1
MQPEAQARWRLDDLRSAARRQGSLPHGESQLIERMREIYIEDMLRTASVVDVRVDGPAATVTIRMNVVFGGVSLPVEFPTTWVVGEKSWRLWRTGWTTTGLRRAHTNAAAKLGNADNHPGYPPFSIGNQNAFRLEEPPRPPRAWFRCPSGMVGVAAGPTVRRYEGQRYVFSGERDRLEPVTAFCIDRYEASRPGATATDEGSGADHPAQSRRAVRPWTGMPWEVAKAACERAGKRLCTGAEWQKAAGGPAGFLYPGGFDFDPEVCNTHDAAHNARNLAPTGSKPECRSPYGVYDMIGNASEWTDELWQDGATDRVLRGGGYNVNPVNGQGLVPFFGWVWVGYGSSTAAIHHHAAGDLHHDDGFRCCVTPK